MFTVIIWIGHLIVEQRLDAYESLFGVDTASVYPLRKLLAASAAESLHNDDRDAFITTVNRYIEEGVNSIELAPSDRVTIVEPFVELPLTIVSSQLKSVTSSRANVLNLGESHLSVR